MAHTTAAAAVDRNQASADWDWLLHLSFMLLAVIIMVVIRLAIVSIPTLTQLATQLNVVAHPEDVTLELIKRSVAFVFVSVPVWFISTAWLVISSLPWSLVSSGYRFSTASITSFVNWSLECIDWHMRRFNENEDVVMARASWRRFTSWFRRNFLLMAVIVFGFFGFCWLIAKRNSHGQESMSLDHQIPTPYWETVNEHHYGSQLRPENWLAAVGVKERVVEPSRLERLEIVQSDGVRMVFVPPGDLRWCTHCQQWHGVELPRY